MISKLVRFFGTLLTILLVSCGGPDPVATPSPEATATPIVVPLPTPVSMPILTRILNEVPDAFDFVREGVYRGGDGVGGAAWFDYDNDGDLDLYVANTKTEPNALFRNDGGTFPDVAEAAGVTNGEGNSGVAAADINNNGCADLFLSGEGGAIGSKPGFPILGVFRLKGQSKRDGSIIVRSCKASLSPVYPIRDAIPAVNHATCPSLSSSGPPPMG